MAALIQSMPIQEPVEAGYRRKDWKHWIDEDGDCQDTRQEVLIEESLDPVTFKTSKECKVATGRWVCPYTGEEFTDPRKLDIDHLVPLAEAHASGGYEMPADERMRFANWLSYPGADVAVKASANRSKGKKDPAQWMPSQGRCEYLVSWLFIKKMASLSMDPAEHKAVTELLVEECTGATQTCAPGDPLCDTKRPR